MTKSPLKYLKINQELLGSKIEEKDIRIYFVIVITL